MDFFGEFIVKRKLKMSDYAISVGGFLLALILTYVFTIFARYLLGFWLLLIAASWYGAYMLMKSRMTEYEYTLTNSEMDIDKIMAKKRRKRVLSVDFKNAEICARTDDENFKQDAENTVGIQKTYDFTGMCENDVYFADFQTTGGKIRILFQPSDSMKEYLKLVNPRAIHIS